MQFLCHVEKTHISISFPFCIRRVTLYGELEDNFNCQPLRLRTDRREVGMRIETSYTNVSHFSLVTSAPY